MKRYIILASTLFCSVAVMGMEGGEEWQTPPKVKKNTTALIDAIKDNRSLRTIRAILSTQKNTLDEVDSWGRTALSWAYATDDNKHRKIVIKLLSVDANVNAGRGEGKPIFVILRRMYKPELDKQKQIQDKEADITSLVVRQLDMNTQGIYCAALISDISPEFLSNLVEQNGLKKCSHVAHQEILNSAVQRSQNAHRLLDPSIQRSQSAKKFFPKDEEKSPYQKDGKNS